MHGKAAFIACLQGCQTDFVDHTRSREENILNLRKLKLQNCSFDVHGSKKKKKKKSASAPSGLSPGSPGDLDLPLMISKMDEYQGCTIFIYLSFFFFIYI
ncbi:hypothetical protein E2C01_007234 [Portunus trituberculatus]|uniref:Uncharacterized protein n=1 Tax=Portunus trituberculatus TaxID=210409 RepID=A0A5B7CXA8_PORTR|nr:hypothetical protein [Portunus trituberculatus]